MQARIHKTLQDTNIFDIKKFKEMEQPQYFKHKLFEDIHL